LASHPRLTAEARSAKGATRASRPVITQAVPDAAR
jgi:hypothetical protein